MIIDDYSFICITFVSILTFLANYMLINNWVFLGFCYNDLCINNNSFSFLLRFHVGTKVDFVI